jgi:high-affinity iron transporter
MLQAFVITLREGIEAFLIVAISLAYLRRSGRGELIRAVHWGIAAALGLSALGGYLLYRASNQEWLEGPLAIVAGISVLALTVQMWRAGRRMRGAIEDRLRASSQKAGIAAFAGVFLFTALMISREGMETSLLLLQLQQAPRLIAGALLGVIGASGVAWLWSRYGSRVPLALFLQTTAIFLCVFVVQLFIYGIHEMSEQNYLPYSLAVHEATEPWGPDGVFGQLLSYSLVLAPLAWLTVRLAGRRALVAAKAAWPGASSASAVR